jgi:hypothetical protein
MRFGQHYTWHELSSTVQCTNGKEDSGKFVGQSTERRVQSLGVHIDDTSLTRPVSVDRNNAGDNASPSIYRDGKKVRSRSLEP